MSATTVTHYPLLFTFLDKVEGNDYLAEVAVHGRLLAAEEGGKWWMYGVNPGGLAAVGDSRAEAYIEFRRTLMRVLFDIAAEAGDFHAFRRRTRRFFDEVNGPALAEWEAAREQVRRGKVNIEGMRRETSESPRRIEITHKQKFVAKHNRTDPPAAVAA
jgi:hypothetical protein